MACIIVFGTIRMVVCCLKHANHLVKRFLVICRIEIHDVEDQKGKVFLLLGVAEPFQHSSGTSLLVNTGYRSYIAIYTVEHYLAHASYHWFR